MLPFLIKANDDVSRGAFITNKTIISYMFGNDKAALSYARELENYKRTLLGLIYLPLACFYSSLIFLSHVPLSSRRKRMLYLRKAEENQKKMKKWAIHAPANHLHKWYLVEAERYRVIG